jgi:chromate transporter
MVAQSKDSVIAIAPWDVSQQRNPEKMLAEDAAVERPSLYRLFLTYLRLSNLTFGGGDAIMAAIYSELVTVRKWLSQEGYAIAYALARITPGTNVLALCAGSAWKIRSWPGAVAAVLAASVPSGIVVMLFTAGYGALQSSAAARGAIAGTMAATVAIMGTAACNLLRPYLDRTRWIPAVVIASASFVLLQWFAMTPIRVLGLAALTGTIWRIPE